MSRTETWGQRRRMRCSEFGAPRKLVKAEVVAPKIY